MLERYTVHSRTPQAGGSLSSVLALARFRSARLVPFGSPASSWPSTLAVATVHVVPRAAHPVATFSPSLNPHEQAEGRRVRFIGVGGGDPVREEQALAPSRGAGIREHDVRTRGTRHSWRRAVPKDADALTRRTTPGSTAGRDRRDPARHPCPQGLVVLVGGGQTVRYAGAEHPRRRKVVAALEPRSARRKGTLAERCTPRYRRRTWSRGTHGRAIGALLVGRHLGWRLATRASRHPRGRHPEPFADSGATSVRTDELAWNEDGPRSLEDAAQPALAARTPPSSPSLARS